MIQEEMEKATYTIPVGPIHPALKEPIQLMLEIEGEKVVNTDVRVGQVHRSIEWLGMNRNNPVQSLYVAERICGICNICHPLCLAIAVEQAANITVPDRAEYIRVIAAEMERIHSHLLWAGVAAHEIGFDTPDMITGTVVGDVYDRIIVRLLEVKQAVEIIEECIDKMPEGPIMSEPKMPRLLHILTDAAGEGIGRVEAPRGEDIHYVRMEAGQSTLATWKVRAPTYANLVAVPTILRGMQIADVPIAFASLDPCMSCTNRVLVTDRVTGRESVLDYEELHRLSVEKTKELQR